MSTLTATIAVQDDAPKVIAEMLRQFPQGRRIRVALTDEDEVPSEVPSLDTFLELVKTARRVAPPCPWQTTEEALRDLREGEAD